MSQLVGEPRDAAMQTALRATHTWFENNSGWAEPIADTLVEWLNDDVCQCADECWVAVDGICEHGLASWWLVLRSMGEHDEIVPPQRASVLSHAPNFRDIGRLPAAQGRTTLPGVIYRSGVMDLLDDADISRLRSAGIRTVIDLRSDDEVQQRVNRLPDGVVTHRLPVHDVSAAPRSIMEQIANGDAEGMGAPMLIRGNVAFATTHTAVFRDVLRLATDPANWPVVIHCTAGKDRTGFAIAALLWALGVDHDAVLDDYQRSNVALEARHRVLLSETEAKGLDPKVLSEMLQSNPEYLQAGHDAAIAAHGSLDAWFGEALGVTAHDRAAWQAAMLEHGAQEE